MTKVHIGTMGWSYNFWVSNFYPNNTKSEEFLGYYSKHFDTVEADSTFYKIPSAHTVTRWKDQTDANFIFSLKFPKLITHVKMLKNCEDETNMFLENISRLEDKLGPLLLQFPSTFESKHVDLLEDFLHFLPKERRYVVEVRNKQILGHRLYSLLRDNNAALVLVDSPRMPEITETTADFQYLRWEGDRWKVKGDSGEAELDRIGDIEKWARKIRVFLDSSIEVFGYFSKYYSGHPPTDARQLLDCLAIV